MTLEQKKQLAEGIQELWNVYAWLESLRHSSKLPEAIIIKHRESLQKVEDILVDEKLSYSWGAGGQ